MNKMIVLGCTAAIAVGTAAVVSYHIATNTELRSRVIRNIQDAVVISKRKIHGMSEDVAMRTAQMTKNPKVNQEWVSQQWEMLGL